MKLLKYILIATLLWSTGEVFAQVRVVSGKITELMGKQVEPIMGVNVNVVNSQNRSLGGTISNMEGFYRLQIPENEKDITLVYSFIGMKTQRIKYTDQTVLNVRLESAVESLGQVEITGKRIDRNSMGITQKEMVSATQKVQMEDLIAHSPVTSIEEALQGQLGGVDIITGGGDPGARSSIRIRGTSTLNASSEPLIVIDDVPYSTEISEDFDFSTANDEDLGALLNISPSDIESIEVLKDAAATAIWGTKGANGVLVIKTKRGKVGKTRFSFSSKFTVKNEPETIPMLNGNQYTALMQEAILNSANYTGMTSGNRYMKLLYDTPEIGYSPDWTYFKEYNQDTDWLSEVRRTALTTDNSFSMDGGGEKATYRFSLGYLSEGGTTIGTGRERLNTSLAIDYAFSNKLKFGADFSYSRSDTDASWAPKESNVRAEAFSKMPNKSPYWIGENGQRTSQYFSHQTNDFEGAFKTDDKKAHNYNPVAMAKESVNNTLSEVSKIIFRVDYSILQGLTYRAWAALDMRNTKNRKFLPQVATGVVWTSPYANQSTDATSDQMSLQTENKLMYIKNWNQKHNLIATGLIRTSQKEDSNFKSVTSGNASSGLSDPIVGSTVEQTASGESEVRSVSAIGLLNYTLLDRYVFQGSVTMESNSSMGKDNRTGYFPTGGFSWNIQNEPFLANTRSWLEEAKIRASVGQSGKSASGASLYLGAFSASGEYMDMSGIHPVRMQLDNLKWETTTEYNVGADFSFFKGRLRFTFDYYQRYVKDLLQTDVEVPATTGYSKIKYYNSGKLNNKGWEFRTDATFYEKKDWKVNGYVNFSRNINEITELPSNMSQENYNFGNGVYAIRVEEGNPLGSFYGYRYKGVYQNKEATYARDKEGNIMNDVSGKPIVMKNGTAMVFPGDAIYEDINHDGVINEYDIVYLGNYMPVITGGAGLTVRWKQLTLSTFFHGRFGQKIINRVRINNESMYGVSNQSTAVLKRWRNEGDATDIPRALYQEGYNYLGSDRFVEDASYLRLKTLTLSYNLPKKVCDRWGMSRMNVFVTGYNLFTWTKYTGQDPEVSIPSKATKLAEDNANTPCSIQFSCGLNLSF
ncbi:SusC/RagA family TonB-linked outer membrane protein [Bacteroides sp. 224]|uniref:SusC/RagA family TonB-linked outer membrane protein n=1 Tax=Bacteroides sp. 224 TaxID=2302936 RepID=UPI0013D5F7D5|nr:SusC/RagA family TonB-linked outer membrane protein [Bacteroides sp. 224]NDV65345.1 SusC/RagA family TonB-linked outer membrane protein [Bacteroides sp. 224]